MNRRKAGLGLLASSALTVAVVLTSTPASADAPVEMGWWTVTNPGGLPAQPPTSVPPDVPADGLLVQGGPDASAAGAAAGLPAGYSALAAVVYELPDGATPGELTLTQAAQSASTPAATLVLCPLRNPTVRTEQGGPIADAPDFDCSHKVTAAAQGDPTTTTTYKFNVSSLAEDGSLAVAILPNDPATRVVLAKPDASSLQVTQGMSSDSGSISDGGSTATGATGTSTPTTTTAGAAPSFPTQPVAAPDAGQAPVVATPSGSSPVNAPTSINAAPVAATGDTGGASPAAVALVIAGLLAGGGLWLMAGRKPLDELGDLADATA